MQYFALKLRRWKVTFLFAGPATPKSLNLLHNPTICIEVTGHFTSPFKISTGPTYNLLAMDRVLASIPETEQLVKGIYMVHVMYYNET